MPMSLGGREQHELADVGSVVLGARLRLPGGNELI